MWSVPEQNNIFKFEGQSFVHQSSSIFITVVLVLIYPPPTTKALTISNMTVETKRTELSTDDKLLIRLRSDSGNDYNILHVKTKAEGIEKNDSTLQFCRL